MNANTTTHIIATNIAHEGQAFIIPSDWRERLAAAGEDPAEWTAFEAAINGMLAEVIKVEWDEDETFETYAAAVRDAGFVVESPDDEAPVSFL